jgi:hypothetical protein
MDGQDTMEASSEDDFDNFKALVLRNAAFLEGASEGKITMNDFVQWRKDQEDIFQA